MGADAKEVRLTEGDVVWVGQTIGDGSEGRFMFGRDGNGTLHIEIVCDKRPTGGIVQVNRLECPNGVETIRWLKDWFDPPPTPMVTVLGC